MFLPSPFLFLCRFKRRWRLGGLNLIGVRVWHNIWSPHGTQTRQNVIYVFLLVLWLVGVWFGDPPIVELFSLGGDCHLFFPSLPVPLPLQFWLVLPEGFLFV